MKNRFLLLSYLLLFVSYSSIAQSGAEVYPQNWWAGMKNPNLQIMVHATNISREIAMLKISPAGIQIADGILLKNIERVENPNYVFLDVVISKDARPGKRSFDFGKLYSRSIDFEIKPRRKGNGNQYAQGVTSADLIYLIMPDRFSNGDPSNDRFTDMNDTSCDRHNPFLRHGGDLQGVVDHLDYFKEIGATALWLTPVVENDMSLTNEGGTMRSAYHGYAFTNQYKIDKRFGGNNGYKTMIDAAHQKGLKVIQDAVYNHIGDKHFLYNDMPAKDWFNQWPSYTNTTFRDEPLVDPYASTHDRDISVNGWFTTFMPDFNQRNPFVANYLTQYAIWAVEEFGIDGWRVDTYFYSDRDFLNKINKALYYEFPHITIFGETTMQSVTEQAFYCQNTINTSWKSNLQGVIDFQWEAAALSALNEKYGWATGVLRLYNILVQDILYKDPMRNQILLDNHDQDRFYSVIGENLDKYKMGIAILLTQRGIPQLYYGTEILMKNFKNPSDAEVRKDFPGGWEGDSVNKFMAAGRTPQENEAFDYVKKIAAFRKNSSAIKTGKLMQYVPSDSVYVYFRYDNEQTVMCIVNSGTKEKQIDLGKYAERTKAFAKVAEVITGKTYNTSEKIVVPGQSCWILELK